MVMDSVGAGVVKFIIVIAISTALGRYDLEVTNSIGACLAVLGVIGYNVLRYREQQKKSEYNRVDEDPFDELLPDDLDFLSPESKDGGGL